jgi:hypothetical protein
MKAKDNLIRALLLGFPLVLLYYLNAAWDWRYEVVNLPFHVRIWNVRGGCIPSDHYLFLDWLCASILTFVFLTLATFLRGGPIRGAESKALPVEQTNLPQKSTN